VLQCGLHFSRADGFDTTREAAYRLWQAHRPGKETPDEDDKKGCPGLIYDRDHKMWDAQRPDRLIKGDNDYKQPRNSGPGFDACWKTPVTCGTPDFYGSKPYPAGHESYVGIYFPGYVNKEDLRRYLNRCERCVNDTGSGAAGSGGASAAEGSLRLPPSAIWFCSAASRWSLSEGASEWTRGLFSPKGRSSAASTSSCDCVRRCLPASCGRDAVRENAGSPPPSLACARGEMASICIVGESISAMWLSIGCGGGSMIGI